MKPFDTFGETSTGPGHRAASEPVQCRVDPAEIRAWLESPSTEEPGLTVAEQLGVEEFPVGSELSGGQMDELVYAGQEAGVFGIPGHRIELWHVADNDYVVDGHLITVNRPDGARVASDHLDWRVLVDSSRPGPDAVVDFLQAAGSAAEHALRRARPPGDHASRQPAAMASASFAANPGAALAAGSALPTDPAAPQPGGRPESASRRTR